MPRQSSSFGVAAFALGALALTPTVGLGATLYVDKTIGSSSCSNYVPSTRACGGGSDRAFRSVSGASSAAVAGDTVYLRSGTYSEQLAPARSGTDSQPITFAAYPGETPTLSGLSNPALWLIGRSYIVVDGLTVDDVLGWGRLEDASHNTIRNCTFTAATAGGTTGGLKLVRSTYNRILGNSFDDGNDNIIVQESDRNVIQGNSVSQARHSLLSLRCGNYNVIRGNTFSNPDQKDLEIYDCEGVSDAPFKLDATKRNLVEDNIIADTRASSADYRYNGIQFAGQQGIVRRNVFQDNLGGGINFQYYSDESLYNNRNRVYHNTYYRNRCYGVVGSSGNSSRFYDNRVRNSILYSNSNCSGSGGQVSIDDASQVILSDNAIVTTSPGFVNEASRDLHLAPGSSMIDAGAFLTTTVSGGSGTLLPVADASYFFDGYGIPGELGDRVQLEGQSEVARIVAVNLGTNRLTLDRALTWTGGLGVTLEFAGAGPDLGAFERDAEVTPELSVDDVDLAEGDTGTSVATFTVALSAVGSQTITVDYATADGSASAGSDYVASSGTLSFFAGVTHRTVDVNVVGDAAPEDDEDLFLDLSGPVGATLGDPQGRATILNDDTLASALSVSDAEMIEGHTGTTDILFVVTLSPASSFPVTVQYATVDGTATAGSDYVASAGNLTFDAGETAKPIAVSVAGDVLVEPNETFGVVLSQAAGATISRAEAVGTVRNDDGLPQPPGGLRGR